MKTKFTAAVIVGIVILASVFMVIAVDSVYLDSLCAEQGGKRDGDVCLVQPVMEANDGPKSEQKEFVNFENVFAMEPNSVEFFFYQTVVSKERTRVSIYVRPWVLYLTCST